MKGLKRRIKYYFAFCLPPLAGVLTCRLMAIDIGVWFFGIIAAAGIGSCYATEITLWQISQPGAIQHPLIRKIEHFLEKAEEMVNETREVLKDPQVIAGLERLLKSIVQLSDAFAFLIQKPVGGGRNEEKKAKP